MDADGTDPKNDVRSRFDSRLMANVAQDTSLEDKILETPRYLTHAAPADLTFDQAFAHIRSTESYTNPPLIAVTPLPPAPQQPKPAIARDAATVVYVNRCQTGNPLLKAIKNVSIAFRDGMAPDYVMESSDGTSTCVLFLSVRYHLLHHQYLEERLDRVKKDEALRYKTRVVLCLVDVDDNEIALREINRLTLLSHFTLLLAWSWNEAARYIETLKAYEHKSATLIKEKVESEFLPKANDVLTCIRSVNKTDVVTLLSTFGTVRNVMNASMEELSLCPGIGAKKVKQLLETFQEPFVNPSNSAS